MLDCVDPCRGFCSFPSAGVFFNLCAKIGTQAAADPVPISFTYSPESFAYRVKILQKKAWNYQKNPYCYSMFKIKDKVINQRGNVGEVVSVSSKGCKLLFKVDFGRVQRFFEAKELSLSSVDLSIEKTLKKS